MNNEQRVAIGPLIPMNRRDVTPVGTGRRATIEEYREGAMAHDDDPSGP
jgi:hypothetical protein